MCSCISANTTSKETTQYRKSSPHWSNNFYHCSTAISNSRNSSSTSCRKLIFKNGSVRLIFLITGILIPQHSTSTLCITMPNNRSLRSITLCSSLRPSNVIATMIRSLYNKWNSFWKRIDRCKSSLQTSSKVHLRSVLQEPQ